MAKTKIEWCDYTVNPVKGLCPMKCPYCYARRLYLRFHWNPELCLDLDAFQFLRQVKQPSRVFVGSTIELFGAWIPRAWMMDILSLCWSYERAGHQFLFLTKCPQNLLDWSPFPPNCWVGATATNESTAWYAMKYLKPIQAKVKFLSFEPLLGAIPNDETWPLLSSLANCGIGWLIIGQQTPTSRTTQPKVEWIREIVQAGDKAGIAIFLKDNLLPLLKVQGTQDNRFWRNLCDSHGFEPLHLLLRQEIPQLGYSV